MAALVLDTCGAEGYVAVVSTEGTGAGEASERYLGVRATQEELLPAVQEVLAEAGVLLVDLEAVAVVSGPGSFTGVRIGLAAAKGLCEAAQLPLLTLSRLEVLANCVPERPVTACLQAGRGDVYAQTFRQAGALVLAEDQRAEPVVTSLAGAVAVAGAGQIVVCEEALRTAATGVLFVDAETLAEALRATAADAIRAGRWADVALSDALYLRVPDAELALRARQA